MKRLLFCLALALPLSAATLKDLAWMAGHWTGEDGGTVMEEIWTTPGGGLLLGLHRDVGANGKSFFEFLRVEETKEGIVYFAQPKGGPPTPFRLVELSGTYAVFTNPKHDFPQRITYSLLEGRLCARVEGEGNRAKEWCWTKSSAAD
jgi:hypothetical protein